jgi:hypothetical protein
MHFRSNSGISRFSVAAIVFFLVIIIIVAIVIIQSSQVPILQVSNISLNPNTINVNGNATLRFTINNNDQSSQHNVTVRFNVTSVFFYINGVLLNHDINLVQYYNIQLQSSEQSTYSFGVTAILTGGASTSTYSILLNFYNENGTNFNSETIGLTVNS